jgi:hypothetical protein
MISVAMTKCQLNADDLIEYETNKAKWKRDPAPTFPRKIVNVSSSPNKSHRNVVNERIGLNADGRGTK